VTVIAEIGGGGVLGLAPASLGPTAAGIVGEGKDPRGDCFG